MSTEKQTPAKGGFIKKLGIISAIFMVLLVGLYLVGTSAWCFKSIILPRAGKALNATIEADDASISPFSSIRISGFRIRTTGNEPVVAAKELSVRYASLFALAGGRIFIDDITISGAMINYVQNADGTSNLDPLLKSGTSEKKDSSPASKGSSQVAIGKISLSDATIRYTQASKAGGEMKAELTGINLTLSDVGNNKTARLEVGAGVRFDQGQNDQAKAMLQSALKGDIKINLNADLAPAGASGSAAINITQAAGAVKDLNAMSINLDLDWTPTEIKNMVVKFSQGNTALGAVSVSGPFDISKMEGKLQHSIKNVDRHVLNLASAAFGLDFTTTTVDSSGEVELRQAGKVINSRGMLKLDRFSVLQNKLQTPELNLETRYDVAVDLSAQKATINSLTISGQQRGVELLSGRLSKPMPLDWSKAGGGVDESAFQLSVKGLNLADWKAFAQEYDPSGLVNLQMDITSQKAGKTLLVDLTSTARNLAGRYESNRIQQADVDLKLKTTIENFNQIKVESLTAGFARQGQQVLAFQCQGEFNKLTQDASFQTTAEASLKGLTDLAPVADLTVRQGTVQFQGQLAQKNLNPAQTNNPPFNRSITGKLNLASLTAKYQQYEFDRFGAQADCDITLNNNLADIRKLALSLSQAGLAAGQAEVTGKMDLAKTNGQFSLRLADVNQNLFQTAAALLAPNKLTSVSINGLVNAKYDSQGESSVSGEIKMVNCLIQDPKGQLPSTPLTAEAALAVAIKKQVAEIKQLSGQVKQGQLSGGSFDVKGIFDMAKTNGQFDIKVADINQNLLNPFLGQSLGEKKMVSISINAGVNAKFDMTGESSVKGSLLVTNLVYKMKESAPTSAPLHAEMTMDGSLKKQLLDLKTFSLQLAPTARANNLLALSGQVNLANSNAVSGALRLKSDAMDVTAYYDLFAGNKQKTTDTPSPAKTSDNTEPPPITLPLTNFTFDAAVGKFYLRDIFVSNLVTALKIDGPLVNLSNLQFILNGAPVKGRLNANLGVAGYVYDVDFKAPQVPMTPFVSSFAPYMQESLKGEVIADMAVKGAGVTGKNMKSKLSGNMRFALTNAAIVPKGLIVNEKGEPNKVLSGWVNILFGIGQFIGIPNVTSEPIMAALMDIRMGNGQINLSQFNIKSENMLIESSGSIPIADVLNDSPLDLPVEVYVSRKFATAAAISSNVSTQATHVKLPKFVQIKGTLGTPETKINKLALGGAVATQVGRAIGGETGGILKSIGGLFGGNTTSVTNTIAPATIVTNAPTIKPATNTVPTLMQQLLSTNQPPARTNTQTITPVDLLNGFLRSRNNKTN